MICLTTVSSVDPCGPCLGDVHASQVDEGLWKLVRLPNEVLLETKRMRDMELW